MQAGEKFLMSFFDTFHFTMSALLTPFMKNKTTKY